jgi:hypothetical protein
VLVICRAAKRERSGSSTPSGIVVHHAEVKRKAAVGAEAAPVVLGCVPATSVLVSVVVVDVLSFSPSRCRLRSAAPKVGSCIVENALLKPCRSSGSQLAVVEAPVTAVDLSLSVVDVSVAVVNASA